MGASVPFALGTSRFLPDGFHRDMLRLRRDLNRAPDVASRVEFKCFAAGLKQFAVMTKIRFFGAPHFFGTFRRLNLDVHLDFHRPLLAQGRRGGRAAIAFLK